MLIQFATEITWMPKTAPLLSTKMDDLFSKKEGTLSCSGINVLIVKKLEIRHKNRQLQFIAMRFQTMLPKISRIIIIILVWLMAASILYVFILKLQVLRFLVR